jgi:large subunit ribosomal protein L33
MAKKKKDIVMLTCSECGSRNYTLRANEKRVRDLAKLELKKYCGGERRHTLHKAKRK